MHTLRVSSVLGAASRGMLAFAVRALEQPRWALCGRGPLHFKWHCLPASHPGPPVCNAQRAERRNEDPILRGAEEARRLVRHPSFGSLDDATCTPSDPCLRALTVLSPASPPQLISAYLCGRVCLAMTEEMACVDRGAAATAAQLLNQIVRTRPTRVRPPHQAHRSAHKLAQKRLTRIRAEQPHCPFFSQLAVDIRNRVLQKQQEASAQKLREAER